MNNQEFSLPVYIAKGVATSGFFYDLGPMVVGIYDKMTNAVATAAGNGKEFFLAGGSIHTKDELTPFYKGMKEPKKSSPFAGKDLISFEKSYAQRPRSEVWALGYSGGDDTNTLAFECDTTYQLKIRLFGEPSFRLFGKSLEKVVTLVTPCCDSTCGSDCANNVIDPKKQTKKWVDLINNNPDMIGFKIKAQPIFSDYVAPTPNSYKYSLTVVDGGNFESLQDVQRAYPTYTVKRLSYSNGQSVYEVAGYTSAPGSFTPKTFSVIADCGTCPAGYTLTAGYDTYVISRQLNTTTDLDDAASQVTFAASIVTAYSGTSGSGVYLGVSNGTAKVRISVTSGTTVAIASGTADLVEKIASQPDICTPSAASAIAWAQSGTGYTTTRQLKVTVGISDCAEHVSAAEVEATLIGTPSYVASSVTDISTASGDICVKTYRVTQRSEFLDGDKCQSPDNVVFKTLPAFRGTPWEEIIPADGSLTVKTGIRFSAPFYSVLFGDCSYDPYEYTDAEPLRMEVSIYDQNMNPCIFSTLAKARRLVKPQFRKFSGDTIRREFIMQALSRYFTYEDFQFDPRSREIVDNTILSQVKSDRYYVAYYLKYHDLRDKKNFNEKSQVFEPVIYVEEGDLATQIALEKALLAVTAKFGVNLTKRG